MKVSIPTLGDMKPVTCNKCGTVAFEVSPEYAENAVARINAFLEKASEEERSHFGNRRASLMPYTHCCCGNDYKNFRDAKYGDCPDGCTLSPVIARNEEVGE